MAFVDCKYIRDEAVTIKIHTKADKISVTEVLGMEILVHQINISLEARLESKTILFSSANQ